MYKDKPYNHASSNRRSPLWKRQRVPLTILGILTALYLLGGYGAVKSLASRSFGVGGVSKWEDRQERVREAFKVSWRAYEEHAWGESDLSINQAGMRRNWI